MSKKMVKLQSDVIRTYTSLAQEIERELEAEKDMRVLHIANSRKKAIKPGKAKKKETLTEKSNKIKELPFHYVEWEKFYSLLEIDGEKAKHGLSVAESNERQGRFGPNKLKEKKELPGIVKYILAITNFFSLLLWLGGSLCLLAYGLDTSDPSNLYLGLALYIANLASGLISYLQEEKSSAIMKAFKNFIPQQVKVYREGKQDPESMDATLLVPGDLIFIKDGDKIPADIRMVYTKEMRVDNSSLTGESDPQLRTTECDNKDNILETKNVAFFGTICKSGEGRGIVFSTGDNTIIGQIASLADSSQAGKTPIRKELDRFIFFITGISMVLGTIFFCLGFILKYSAIMNIIFGIGIIVANVPEGMLATITIALSIAAKRLAGKKILVKNLEGVETLGSTSCICSDKTGTLTQNRMTVENLFFDLKLQRGDNLEKMGPGFKYEYDKDSEGFKMLQDCAVINSTAFFSSPLTKENEKKLKDFVKKHKDDAEGIKRFEEQLFKENKEELKTKVKWMEREVEGDASETALVKFFQPIRDIEEMRRAVELAKTKVGDDAVIAFNSAHKFTLRICRLKDSKDSNFRVFLKGAPERVWIKCSHYAQHGKILPMTPEKLKEIEAANTSLAKRGERVLGFAKMDLSADKYDHHHKFDIEGIVTKDVPEKEFIFLGLISLIDPPRDAVPMAIDYCRSAGVKVIMVTGDQQVTAAAIAKTIRLFTKKTSLEIQEELGCSYEEAIEKAEAIVINGEMLTHAVAEDAGLPEKAKGRKIESWLMKPEIVFARTSPAQKLYIVQHCQKLDHVVAVTGDGVNDSPAIKQGDIGIAMGLAGTDVAKDAADMILLNDNFAAIVYGIEEGRKIFDNLKKTMFYVLTSNIPEIWPYIFFMIIQIPLPLSTILILLIDLGTDIPPSLSFGYEPPELDLMTRRPRSKEDHLFTLRLLLSTYIYLGTVQAFGAFLTYFIIMQDFGFNPTSLIFLLNKDYIEHNPGDIYDPNDSTFGNTNFQCELSDDGSWVPRSIMENKEGGYEPTAVDWLFLNDRRQDLRMGFLECDDEGRPEERFPQWTELCINYQVSMISGRMICWSTEALKYAQTSFFFSIVITQFCNSLNAKTRYSSITQQSIFINFHMLVGWCFEGLLVFSFSYFRYFNYGLGTRDLTFWYFGVIAIPFGICMWVFEEIRKLFLRNLPDSPKTGPNWFKRMTMW